MDEVRDEGAGRARYLACDDADEAEITRECMNTIAVPRSRYVHARRWSDAPIAIAE